MRSTASRHKLLTFGLAGLCAALAVRAFVPAPPEPPPASTGRVSVAGPDGNGLPGIAMRRHSGDSPAFRRPIFVPSRRLPDGGTGGVASVGALKLKAVFLGPDTEKALLISPGSQEGRWVVPGQSVDGWRVEEIHAESVVLMGPDGRRTLELDKPENTPDRRTQRPSRKRRGGGAANKETRKKQ